MKPPAIISWPTQRAAAQAIQRAAVEQIEIHCNVTDPQTIVAVDTDYGVGGSLLYAAAVVLTFPDCLELERTYAHREVTFPYIPGLLFFREGPVIVDVLSQLNQEPDVIMVNGHGIAHPQRCGMASHLGVLFDRPSIGCARKLLIGSHRPVDDAKGSSQPLLLQGKEVGLVYRTKDSVKPLYLSPGHKCDINFARSLVAQTLRGYRLPEPMRIAHLLVNRYRQREERAISLHTATPSDGLHSW